ncbi:NUDIX hydrolase [Candidatus Pacearchaeota archaeon]|nr:NUDIX hydrolase [Candidatus Pacearchaeota archaeon]
MEDEKEKLQKQFIIVKGLIVNSEGHILMIQRDREWHKEAHAKWEFPGGKVDFGETPEEACIREAKEESGANIEIDYLVPKIHTGGWVYPDRETHQVIICYKCNFLGGEISLEDHGVSDAKWFDVDEIDKLDCLPGTKVFTDEYRKIMKK